MTAVSPISAREKPKLISVPVIFACWVQAPPSPAKRRLIPSPPPRSRRAEAYRELAAVLLARKGKRSCPRARAATPARAGAPPLGARPPDDVDRSTRRAAGPCSRRP